ncbi:MAG: flagellar filament capping protein FliD, partial [bacterium]|nr:flagellar filament capping protein FliD [bacterium]
VINGKAVAISTSDSLSDIKDAINNANKGVQAQILSVSDTDHRLLLTSETAGKEGFSLLDASTSNVLQSLGFMGTATSIKNPVTGGAKTDLFVSSTTAVGSLMGLSSSLSGTVTIGNKTVAIDLSSNSLTDIKNAIDAAAPAGVTTSIVSEEDADGVTRFRLQIDGTTTLADSNNVLESIGILQGTSDLNPAIAEVHTANVANTTNGSDPTDANTKFSDVFGASVVNGDTISISGTTHDGTSVSGTFSVSNVNSDKMQDLLDQIRTVFSNDVTATIDSNGKLVVTDDTTGSSQLSVTVQANNEGGGLLNFGILAATTEGEDARSREVVVGQDASFRVNGVTLNRSSNTISDAIAGVTLTLNEAKAGTNVRVDVSRDTSAIRSNIESFVAAYNEAQTLIGDQFVFDEDTQRSGPLSGDATLLTLQSQLRSIVISPVSGLADGENSLTLFGVEFNREGLLEIDSDTLDDALANNLTALRRVMTAQGTTSDSDVEFVFQTDDTTAGTFDINITTAAEQATTIGTTDLTAGLAAAETLTITDVQSSKSETIDLAVGDKIDDIVTKINSTLSSSVAEVKTGSVANTTDGATAITGTTTFSSIFGTNVVANDTIDIQGNLHSGEAVSGSFSLSDPTTQKVNDLLAEIRSIFQGTVSTSIDANGQIVVTDNQVGNSQMVVVLLERNEGGGSLNFGSLDTSSEGRFSIGVTASNEGGKLRLTSDSYGDDIGFTVGQNTAEMGLTDATYTGVDVAGTINGEAATSSGRILTGLSSSSNISGLSLRVNLTAAQLSSQGGDQGSVTITQGVTDLLRRQLESITDPFDGLVANRESAIEDTIQAAQDQIASMERRILLKQNSLARQFTAMEIALAEFNSLGSFLGAQLASLPTASSR